MRNIYNLSKWIPWRISLTVLRVSTVPSAIFPIKSYFIWLDCVCFNVFVLVFSPANDSPRSISYWFISDFCCPTVVVYCSWETNNLLLIHSIDLRINSLLSNSTVYAYLWFICFHNAWNSALSKFAFSGFSFTFVSWPSVNISFSTLSSYTAWINIWIPSAIGCNSSGKDAKVPILASVRYLSVTFLFIST